MTPPPTNPFLSALFLWPASVPPIQYHHQYALPTFSNFTATIAQTARATTPSSGRRLKHSNSSGSGSSSSGKPGGKPGGDPELPKANFSLKELGASRTVRVVVLTSLSIAGAVETYGWYAWLSGRYGKGRQRAAEAVEGGE